MLAILKAERLRVLRMVNASVGFNQFPLVINGFTDLIVTRWAPNEVITHALPLECQRSHSINLSKLRQKSQFVSGGGGIGRLRMRSLP